MNWDPAMLHAHYTLAEIVIAWTVKLPLFVAFMMLVTLTAESLTDMSIRQFYNPKANWFVRGTTVCIVCPLFVLLWQTVTFLLMLLVFFRLVTDER